MIHTGQGKTRNDINLERVILHEKEKRNGNKAEAIENQADRLAKRGKNGQD